MTDLASPVNCRCTIETALADESVDKAFKYLEQSIAATIFGATFAGPIGMAVAQSFQDAIDAVEYISIPEEPEESNESVRYAAVTYEDDDFASGYWILEEDDP